MMKFRYLLTLIFIVAFAMPAFAQDDFPEDLLEQGSIELSDPELVLEEEFDDEDAWENYDGNNGSVMVDEDDEVYIVEIEYEEGANFLWGQDTRIFGNTVIQIDAEQLSNDDNTGYGIMCRADPSNNSNGYLFFISGDGFVQIQLRTEDGAESLYEWEESDAVEQGEEENELVVVCVDDYLGFYVNGELVAEAQDDTFDEGVIALAAAIYVEDEDAEIAFDNLLVWEVEGSGSSSSNSSNNDSSDIDDLADDIADMLEDGDIEIELDDLLFVETWDDGNGEWYELDEDEYVIEADDDGYRIQEEAGALVWGTNSTDHDDVVIYVEVERDSDGEASGFGIMCRVDPDNVENGYSFLITSDGFYSIGIWEDNEFDSLLDEVFVRSSDLEEEDSYTMTVVCVDEYLALYVDGELIGEVEDDTYDEGYTGVAAISFDDDGVDVLFDNMIIWEGKD